jgi:hypothetical protein
VSRRTADEGQPSTRRPGTVYDQHKIPGVFPEGRPWFTYIDNRSGLPLGPFQPLGWSAPWEPPQGAAVFLCDENNPSRITINYDHIIDADEAAMKEVEDSRKQAAAARGWDPTDPEKQDLLDKVASPLGKTRPPQIAYAAKMGDLWILGATNTVNQKLFALLPKKTKTEEARRNKYADVLVGESLADDLEARMDLQEQFDKNETPRGRVPVKSAKQPKSCGAFAMDKKWNEPVRTHGNV